MENKNLEEKEVKEVKKVDSEKKINLNYIEFIKNLIIEKVVVDSKNKELVEKKYKEIVDLRFNNIKRVSKRIDRKEISGRKILVLSNMGVSEKEYNRVNKLVMELSSEKKRNYF